MSEDTRPDRTTDPDRVEPVQGRPVEGRPADVHDDTTAARNDPAPRDDPAHRDAPAPRDDAALAGSEPAAGTPAESVGDAAAERRTTTETTSSSGVAATSATEPAPAHGREIPRDPSSERVVAESSGPGAATDWSAHTGLLPDDDLAGYQKRWDEIQVGFIDEPRQSVRSADDLVGEITHQIAQRFTDARQQLEQRWDGGDDPTTEELRQAVQRYRDFFQRLVAR